MLRAHSPVTLLALRQEARVHANHVGLFRVLVDYDQECEVRELPGFVPAENYGEERFAKRGPCEWGCVERFFFDYPDPVNIVNRASKRGLLRTHCAGCGAPSQPGRCSYCATPTPMLPIAQECEDE